jgi:hypothetical protein
MPRQVGRWGPSPFSVFSMLNTSIATERIITKKLLVFAALGLLYLLGCSDSFAQQLRDGDIIFQTSRSEQSTAIQKATRSQYSHMGIAFFRNGGTTHFSIKKALFLLTGQIGS